MLGEISDIFEYIFTSDEEAEVEDLGVLWYPSGHLFPCFNSKFSCFQRNKSLNIYISPNYSRLIEWIL